MPHFPLWLGTAVLGLFALPLAAQRTHVAGLIGEPPDTSNWPHPAAPDGNLFPRSTASPTDIARRDRIAELGKVLFWDEQVSTSNTMACGTCHAPRAGGTDDRLGAVHANGNFGSFGVIRQSDTGSIDYGFQVNPSTDVSRQVTPVAAPTMIGAYMFERLFWDSRAGIEFHDDFGNPIPNFTDWAALEDLAVGPPANDVEMGHESLSWLSGHLQGKLNRSYPLALVDPSTIPPDVQWMTSASATYDVIFDKVFHWHPQFGGMQGVTRERFALALAHYHRTLIPDQAPIDRGTLTPAQIHGFHLMETRGDCFRCHSATSAPALGPNGTVDPFDNLFSDGLEHDIDLPGQGRRKTPTLRNLGLHRKFFSTGHGSDGISNVFVLTHQDLIDFYNHQPGRLGFDPPLSPSEQADVLDFLLNGLTDPRVAAETFPFDRPQLYSELHPFGANLYGAATPGPSGFLAQILADVPPKVPTAPTPDWFKVGVGNTVRFAAATLMLGAAPDVGPVAWVSSVFALIPATTNNEGIATVQQPVVLTPALIGIPIFCQWEIDDYGMPTFSDAAQVVPY
jgi:cytochrome c peroxidase